MYPQKFFFYLNKILIFNNIKLKFDIIIAPFNTQFIKIKNLTTKPLSSVSLKTDFPGILIKQIKF